MHPLMGGILAAQSLTKVDNSVAEATLHRDVITQTPWFVRLETTASAG